MTYIDQTVGPVAISIAPYKGPLDLEASPPRLSPLVALLTSNSLSLRRVVVISKM